MTDPAGAHAPRFLVPAELGLFGLSVATIYGFSRLFADGGFFLPMLVVAVCTHALCTVTRRRGFSVPAAAAVSVPAIALLLTWIFFFEDTVVGLPTGATLDALRSAADESWRTFQDVVAPAPAQTGFVLASCAALFFAIFLADWAAFRLWSAFEAIVPASTLFIFCSLLGSEVHQVDATAVFLAAALGFLLLHRIARRETSSSWLTSDIERGSRSALRTGAALTAAALVAGVVIGPRLPGAESPAVISWRDANSGSGSRVTVSPLVDIRDRLTNQSSTELFTVRSNGRAYWRLTSLDIFGGDIWRSGGQYPSVDGDLPTEPPPDVAANELTQAYDIEALAAIWLPAAFEPRSVSAPDAELLFQPASSTLIVGTQVETSDGLRYEVRSAQPDFSAEQLDTASAAIPQDVAERYTELPADFSPTASALAQSIVAEAGASSAYAKAKALQDHFRSGEYAYDLTVPAGHSESAIDEFLAVKRGYCEQFAGTYAAMARSIGLPARVAVGFTPGEQDPSDPNRYRVSGKHAHAWPEVYIGQYGWVPMEPTPGRGAPNAERWTEVPEQQDATPAPTTGTTTVTVPGSAVTSSSVPAPVDPLTTSTLPAPDPSLVTTGPTSSALDNPVVRLALAAALVLVALGAYAAAMLALAGQRRRRRREQATTDRARIQVAWQESVEALELIGTRVDPSETHDEFARRAQEVVAGTGTALVELAHDVDAAAYAPELETEDLATRAEASAAVVVAAASAQVTRAQRWRHVLDPRPHLPRRRLADRHRAWLRR